MAGEGARFSFEEHTSEVAIRIWAPTPAALFAKAGEALAELMLGGEDASGPEDVHEEVAIEAPDRAALLVTWLDELVFRAERAKAVFTRFDIGDVTDQHLSVTIHGRRPPAFRNPVKAATYHDLALGPGPDRGVEARVVLDV